MLPRSVAAATVLLLSLASTQAHAQQGSADLVYVGTYDPDDEISKERCREKFYPAFSYREGALAGLYVPLPVIYSFRDKQVKFGSGVGYDLEWRFIRPRCSSLGRMTLRAKPEDGWQVSLVVSLSPLLLESKTETTQTRVDVVELDPQTGEPVTTQGEALTKSESKVDSYLGLGLGAKATYNFKTDTGMRRVSLGLYLGWQFNVSRRTGSAFIGPIITIR